MTTRRAASLDPPGAGRRGIRVALLSGLLLVAACADAPPGERSRSFDLEPAREALQRLLPTAVAGRFELAELDAAGEEDAFEVSEEAGRVVVRASDAASLLAGVGWYLKEVAGVSLTWAGNSLARLPERLPEPPAGYGKRAVVPHRFVGNDTWSAYTGPYWTFERWRAEIDVLAASGVNEVLVYPGAASVYYETFRELGIDDAALRAWIPLPAHQPWFLMHNMYGITAPIPLAMLEEQAVLGRRVADLLRSLGMTPVLPGYYGMVPPGFAERFPEARVIDQGVYLGTPFPQSPQLDPTDPVFAQVAELFYEKSEDLFGASDAYMATPYHEGGDPGTTPLPEQYRAIQEAMQRARPGAKWVLLAWFLTPTLLDGIRGADPAHVLVLDGTSDSFLPIDPVEDLAQRPFALGSIWQFGGRTQMAAWLGGLLEVFGRHREGSGSLSGIALLPEANDNNPAAFVLLTELGWQEPADLASWFASFAAHRYGGSDAHAEAAWRILGETVYGTGNAPTAAFTLEASDAFAYVPDVTRRSNRSAVRDDARVDDALAELLAVDASLRDTSAYAYDLMDVARQVLGNHAYLVHDRLVEAFAAGDVATFTAESERWLSWLALADELAGTNSQTLLGRYHAEARAWGPLAALDALQLVTIWAEGSGGGPILSEYANRGWQGLYGDYYAPRWRTYLTQAVDALRDGTPLSSFDAYADGEAWTRAEHAFPTEPSGDVHDVARRVLEEVRSVGRPER